MPSFPSFPSLSSIRDKFKFRKGKSNRGGITTPIDKIFVEPLPTPSIISSRPSFSSAPSYQSRASSSSGVTRCPSYSSQPQEQTQYINAAAFDGGGVRGASSAMVMQIILQDLAEVTGKEEHAYEHFDILGGTSTGGLIAVMVGRLKVPIDVLLEMYEKLSSRLFNVKFKLLRSILQGCKYSGAGAQKSYEAIVEEYDEQGPLATMRDDDGRCNVFVTTVNIADTTGDPLVLRSYDVEQSYTIAEAAQATTAAPTFFPPKSLSSGDVVVDGGVRFNNPTELLLQEARRKFGKGVKFGLLLSVGTGEKSPVVMKKCSSAMSLMSLPKTMGQIMTDSEAVHQRLQSRFEEMDLGTYVRINVPCIGDIALDDFKSIPEIIKATKEFMDTPDMLEVRKDVTEMLLRSMIKGN